MTTENKSMRITINLPEDTAVGHKHIRQLIADMRNVPAENVTESDIHNFIGDALKHFVVYCEKELGVYGR